MYSTNIRPPVGWFRNRTGTAGADAEDSRAAWGFSVKSRRAGQSCQGSCRRNMTYCTICQQKNSRACGRMSPCVTGCREGFRRSLKKCAILSRFQFSVNETGLQHLATFLECCTAAKMNKKEPTPFIHFWFLLKIKRFYFSILAQKVNKKEPTPFVHFPILFSFLGNPASSLICFNVLSGFCWEHGWRGRDGVTCVGCLKHC